MSKTGRPGLRNTNMTSRGNDMTIIIDTREQRPYGFQRLDCQPEFAALPAGDYSLPGFTDRIAVERKELNDLVACLMGKNRERFERELGKAKSYEVFAVVVEASMQDIATSKYKSKMKPHAALQSIAAFTIRHRVPFLFCGSRQGAEYMTYSLLAKYLYEIEKRFKAANKGQRGSDE